MDVVIAECAPILQLLSGENETLLVWRDALLVLNLALHIVDGVTGLDLESDGLTREGLDEAKENLLVPEDFAFGDFGDIHLHYRNPSVHVIA